MALTRPITVEERITLSFDLSFSALLPPSNDTGSGGNATATAEASAAAFANALRVNATLLQYLAGAYLPQLGVNVSLVRQLSATAADVLSVDPPSSPQDGGTAQLRVRLLLLLALPPGPAMILGSTGSGSSSTSGGSSTSSRRAVARRQQLEMGLKNGLDRVAQLGQGGPGAEALAQARALVYELQRSLLGAAATATSKLQHHRRALARLQPPLRRSLATGANSDGSRRIATRMLSGPACSTTASELLATATNLTIGGGGGAAVLDGVFGPLGGVAAASSTCATAEVDTFAVAISAAAGAVSTMLDLSSEVTSALTAADATIAVLNDKFDATDSSITATYVQMRADASAATATASARAGEVVQLLLATLAAQEAVSGAADQSGFVLAELLGQTQAALVLVNATTELILSGISDLDPGSDEWDRLQACLDARGVPAGFAVHFNITHTTRTAHAGGAGKTNGRRTLLQQAEAASAPQMYDGYSLHGTSLERKEYLLGAAFSTASAAPGRYIGSAGGNRILAGLLLHQQRLQPTDALAPTRGCGGRYDSSLTFVCGAAAAMGRSRAAAGLGGIGIDAVRAGMHRCSVYRLPCFATVLIAMHGSVSSTCHSPSCTTTIFTMSP